MIRCLASYFIKLKILKPACKKFKKIYININEFFLNFFINKYPSLKFKNRFEFFVAPSVGFSLYSASAQMALQEMFVVLKYLN